MNQKTNEFHRLQVGVLKFHSKNYPIYEGVNTIGRNKEATVNIKHLNISQNHAVVVTIKGDHFISDLNSSNGSFLENQRADPFKLFKLKNNANIKLGDLYGTYISEGPFSDNVRNHFEMTQDFTQSFYGSNTQILDNSKINSTQNETEDIHEAPTQEISWTTFKIPKGVKSAAKSIIHTATLNKTLQENTESQEEDLNNCATQGISESRVSQNDQSNKSHDKNVVVDQNVTSNNKRTKADSQFNNSVDVGEDIHDAPTQIFPLLLNNSDDNDKILPESEFFGPFNDEELPLHENNDNYVEIHQIPKVDKTLDIHEAVTQVVDISNKTAFPTSNLEDDEATDCEDNIDAVDIKLNTKCLKEKNVHNTFQDEVTDCEDATQDNQLKPTLIQENKNKLENDDSNDSMEFFKVDRSISKESKETLHKLDAENDASKENTEKKESLSIARCNLRLHIENSSDETIRFKKKKIRHVSSSSDSDDEDIGFRRKKKSSMVISTQDICEKEGDDNDLKVGVDLENPSRDAPGIDKETKNQDSYFINDTDSDTEIESTSKASYLEVSIPATQDLNDTDCIPATQEVMTSLPLRSTVRSSKNCDNANGSSEESFKLGLTELMTNPSQVTNNSTNSQDPCCSKSLQNPSPILGESMLKNNENVNNIQASDSDKTDTYVRQTQENQIIGLDGDDNIENLINNQSTLDTYLAPTQRVILTEKGSTPADKLDNLNDTDYPYEVATQKINSEKIKLQINDDSQLNATNDDFYFAPTQKIDFKETSNRVGKGGHLNASDDDIYFASTQKVSNKLPDADQNSSREESMDTLYLQPTQQLDETFNAPTQKVDKPGLKNEGSKEGESDFTTSGSVMSSGNSSLRSKKIFSFKHRAPCLDGSLTTLLDHSSGHTHPQSFLERDDRSSIEVEIISAVNAHSVTTVRPSNPLSHVLENASELDDAVKTKEHETAGVVTDESVEKNEVVSSYDKNKKEIIYEKHNAKNEDSDPKFKNENKIDSAGVSVPRHVAKEEITLNDQLNANADKLVRSLSRGQTSTQNRLTSKLVKTIDSDLSQAKPQAANNEKNVNVENKLRIKLVPRRNTRRLSSSSDTKIGKGDLNGDEKHSQDNILNATSNDVNQSVALLESKITKTRKTRKSAKILVKVPKERKSMTISEIDDTSEPVENVNNNVLPKYDQEKISQVDMKIKSSRFSASKLSIVTKTRGRPKRRQSTELVQEMDTTKEGKKNLVILKSNQRSKQNLSSKEKETNIDNNVQEDMNNIASTSKVTTRKTRQVGKRKQVPNVNSDISDACIQSIDSNITTPKKRKTLPSRQVGKRKQPLEVKSENSDSSLQSLDSSLVTPKKQKLQPSDVLLNTKERELRKQKPKVVFTMLENPQMESMIKQLGGSVIDSVDACTVLLTEHVKRSQKLLSAVGLGKPICSPKWITDSKKAHKFLDPWDYILTDPEAEKKWNFSLKESLQRGRTKKLLNSYNFQIMVTNAADVLKGAIESCGGKCISKIPFQPLENTFIISAPESQSKFRRVTKKHANIKVIAPEAIFDGVLRQELEFSKHYLT